MVFMALLNAYSIFPNLNNDENLQMKTNTNTKRTITEIEIIQYIHFHDFLFEFWANAVVQSDLRV